MTRYIYYFTIIVRLLLLAISVCGYLRYLATRVRPEFAVGVLFSSIGSVMFFAGIFHILRETVWIVFAGGIWLAVQSVKKQKIEKDVFVRGGGTTVFLV